MQKDLSLYEDKMMSDMNFPIQVFKCSFQSQGTAFHNHWHEQWEFLFFTKGTGRLYCNSIPMEVEPEDLVVINSNDLHELEITSTGMEYYVIIVYDSLLRSSSPDICEAKYISPLMQNNILFKNKIGKDKRIVSIIESIIDEYCSKEIGFELAIKSSCYSMMVLLLRNYIEKILTMDEYNSRVRNLGRIKVILEFIKNNYMDDIKIDRMAKMLNISTNHFCRLFKEITGTTLSTYVNSVRIKKAEELLADEDMNISQIAIAAGFSDLNYFSRLFKKYKKVSPLQYRKEKLGQQTLPINGIGSETVLNLLPCDNT